MKSWDVVGPLAEPEPPRADGLRLWAVIEPGREADPIAFIRASNSDQGRSAVALMAAALQMEDALRRVSAVHQMTFVATAQSAQAMTQILQAQRAATAALQAARRRLHG